MNRVYKVFPGGKFKVLTLSYDDGKLDDKRLVDIFNKNNIKATFNLNSGIVNPEERIDKSEWAQLYKGHEIAVHTISHPTMGRCNDYNIIREILDDKTELEKIIKKPVLGIAYPNGSTNSRIEEISRVCGLKYARIVGDKYSAAKAAQLFDKDSEGPILVGDENGFGIPDDYMNWLPTCHHNHNLMDFAKKFAALSKKQYLYMMYVWGHSFEFTKNDNWNIIEEFCEFIGNRDDIWYATNIEIVEYNELFDRLQFFADNQFVYNPSVKSVWIRVNDGDAIEIKGGETVDLG